MRIAAKLSVGRKMFVSSARMLIVCGMGALVVAGTVAAQGSGQSMQQALDRAMTASAADSKSTSTITADSPLVAKFEYEVASIKVSKTGSVNGGFRFGMRNTDDGLSVENFPLMLLVQQAYGVGKDRITGAPDWLNSEHYDIEAKMDGALAEELKTLSADMVRAARQHMLRKLLEQRFELTSHRETKDLPVYNLVIAKGGLKLQESKPDDNAAKGDKPTDAALAAALAAKMGSASGPSATGGGSKIIAIAPSSGASFTMSSDIGRVRTASAKGVTIAALASSLASIAGRPVMDKTGLTGKYDYKLEFSPEDSQSDAEPAGPSIFTAVQEQLGLKLEAAKGPVEIVVIDHIEKPSGN
jgi:uncharacterized protein (TIGR03435 family)